MSNVKQNTEIAKLMKWYWDDDWGWLLSQGDQMSNRELDAQVAELMGLPVKYHTNNPNNERFYYVDTPDENMMCPDVAHYSRDIAAAYEMEKRIEELGLIDEYCYQVHRVTLASWNLRRDGITHAAIWRLIHASPEDRCLAAIRTMEAMKKRK